jgi:hypothetical protein
VIVMLMRKNVDMNKVVYGLRGLFRLVLYVSVVFSAKRRGERGVPCHGIWRNVDGGFSRCVMGVSFHFGKDGIGSKS